MNPLIDVWRSIIVGNEKSWVLFRNGTCVILVEPEEDLAAQAIALMKEWGPVHAGCSAGDFGTITLNDGLGWAVTSHHDVIFTFVGPDEVAETDGTDLGIGIFGRSKRDRDAQELDVIHVEDRRLSD